MSAAKGNYKDVSLLTLLHGGLYGKVNNLVERQQLPINVKIPEITFTECINIEATFKEVFGDVRYDVESSLIDRSGQILKFQGICSFEDFVNNTFTEDLTIKLHSLSNRLFQFITSKVSLLNQYKPKSKYMLWKKPTMVTLWQVAMMDIMLCLRTETQKIFIHEWRYEILAGKNIGENKFNSWNKFNSLDMIMLSDEWKCYPIDDNYIWFLFQWDNRVLYPQSCYKYTLHNINCIEKSVCEIMNTIRFVLLLFLSLPAYLYLTACGHGKNFLKTLPL